MARSLSPLAACCTSWRAWITGSWTSRRTWPWSSSSRHQPTWPALAEHALRWAARLALALVGAVLGVLLAGRITADVGPFVTQVGLTFGAGEARVGIPPLGALTVDAYDGPVRIEITLQTVDQDRIEAIVRDPNALNGIGDEVAADLQSAAITLLVRSGIAAVLGAAILSMLVFRRTREPFIAAGLSVVLLAGTAGLARQTFRPEALTRPTYTGLLENAPALIGSATDLATRFEDYRRSLTKLVTNLSGLYAAVQSLPTFETGADTVRVLDVSDLHLNPTAFDLIGSVADQFDVDVVVDTGDITDFGSQPEDQFINGIGRLRVPYVFVGGNHDSAVTEAAVAAQPNAVVLDASGTTVSGLDIVGVGDPRFTPDKSTRDDDAPEEFVVAAGERLDRFIERTNERPDIALVHDPLSTAPLAGDVPLVLAGHTHTRGSEDLGDGTLLLIQGSTGGAGLRGLEGEEPTPLSCTVLYVSRISGLLQAYDDITLGGLGMTEVTIVRTVIDQPGTDGDGAEDGADPTD